MFKSPSHYWNASQTDFLHSKGSAHVELSIDPFNKTLIRIFCQSVDKMVNYKSIEYCSRTTVQQAIEKIIKILRIQASNEQYVLIETVGRCLLIDKDGSTTKIIAKTGQPSIYIEQNRRTLMNADYILTVLNYWKPMAGFSRRFELCSAEKNHQMTSCDNETNENSFLPEYFVNDSVSTLSHKSNIDYEDKCIQTDTQSNPPVAPRRRMSLKPPRIPHLLLLKGDDIDDQDFMLSLSSTLEFGSPGSEAQIILKQLKDFQNQKICVFTKNIDSNNTKSDNRVYFENLSSNPKIFISINGIEVVGKVILQPGDIINIGDYYSYFFKDSSLGPKNPIRIKHFINLPATNIDLSKRAGNNLSDMSDQAVTSSSISSCSDINNSALTSARLNKVRKKVSIDLHGISISSFDTPFNQILIHYFDGRMNLMNAVTFALYLIRFCRESTRCSFTLDEMQDRIKKRFAKSLEMAYEKDYYLLGSLKLTAFTFQLWLVYNNENYIETSEENRCWLNFLETFTIESFDHLSNYICETSQNLSACFFEENPFLNFDEQQKFREDGNINTVEKFLNFLTDTYQMISNIDCDKMSDLLKTIFMSRIVVFITESTVIQLLSDMKHFNWNKGIQISTQLEKFENWLTDEGLINIFETDGFLRDFSRLISTRAVMLQKMNWKAIRKTYSKVPSSVLTQYLSGLASDNLRILSNWQPTSNEITESNRDVVDVLSQYLRSAENFTLFEPGIILQTDCIPVDKYIQSTEFIALCTVLDTELIAMGENFQWMALPKPPSLVNFKNSKWVALRKSIGEDTYDSFSPKVTNNLLYTHDTKVPQRKFQTDSDYSSLSNKGDGVTPSRKLIAKYHLLKSNLQNHSKSLVSLIEPENAPKAPRRKKNKGSFSDLSQPVHCSNASFYLSTNVSKARESFGNKSCFTRIGRSESAVSDLSTPVNMDNDTDTSSCINDVDQSIEEMEREIQNTNNFFLKSEKYNNHSSVLSPTENGFEDDEDEMSVGLSAAGLVQRLKSHSKSSDTLIEIDKKQVEVTLSKSNEESYGITLADGTQTNLRCEGIFIYKITRYSPAFKNGKMKPGDRIIAINNYNVDELSFQECLMLITKSPTSVTLLIEKSDLKTTLGIMSIYQ